MKKELLNILLLLSSMLIFNFCGKEGSEESETDFYLFDKSKIGISVADQELGIKFSPPKNWELTPASLSKKIESRNNQGDTFVYQPIYVFFDDSTGSLLSVGKVTPTDSTMSIGSRLNFYKSMLIKKYEDQESDFDSFVHSKISFNQLRLQKENLVSFKIFFQNKQFEIIQLEYTLRKENFSGDDPYIKSSIGSIKFL